MKGPLILKHIKLGWALLMTSLLLIMQGDKARLASLLNKERKARLAKYVPNYQLLESLHKISLGIGEQLEQGL